MTRCIWRVDTSSAFASSRADEEGFACSNSRTRSSRGARLFASSGNWARNSRRFSSSSVSQASSRSTNGASSPSACQRSSDPLYSKAWDALMATGANLKDSSWAFSSKRPARPLPSAKGWMASKAAWNQAQAKSGLLSRTRRSKWKIKSSISSRMRKGEAGVVRDARMMAGALR